LLSPKVTMCPILPLPLHCLHLTLRNFMRRIEPLPWQWLQMEDHEIGKSPLIGIFLTQVGLPATDQQYEQPKLSAITLDL
jgi:hypothetical protein